MVSRRCAYECAPGGATAARNTCRSRGNDSLGRVFAHALSMLALTHIPGGKQYISANKLAMYKV